MAPHVKAPDPGMDTATIGGSTALVLASTSVPSSLLVLISLAFFPDWHVTPVFGSSQPVYVVCKVSEQSSPSAAQDSALARMP